MSYKKAFVVLFLGAFSLQGMQRSVMEKISDLFPMPLLEKMQKQEPITDPLLELYGDIFKEKDNARVVIANETKGTIKIVYNPNIYARPSKQRKFTYLVKKGDYKLLFKDDIGSNPRVTINKDGKEISLPIGADSRHIIVIEDKKSFMGNNYSAVQLYLVNQIDKENFELIPVTTQKFK